MKYLLALIPVIAIAGEQEVRQEIRDAEEYVEDLYQSPPVARFCQANPEKRYIDDYKGRPVEVICKDRNEWARLRQEQAEAVAVARH